MATNKTAAAETAAVETEATAVQAKVLRTYRDRETLKLQKAGSVVTLTEERYKELSDKKFVSQI